MNRSVSGTWCCRWYGLVLVGVGVVEAFLLGPLALILMTTPDCVMSGAAAATDNVTENCSSGLSKAEEAPEGM